MTPRAPRKNVMLAATISSSILTAPVRIRNLSEAGAMIDGPALAGRGSTLTLSRLEMSIAATVIWNRDGRCGLQLNGPITVEDWIAGVCTTAPGHVRLGQSRVDQIQAAIRTGAVLPLETEPPAPQPADSDPIEQRIAAELARVKQMLDEVSEELTDDVDILTRHQQALQNFDIAAMIVEALAAVMAAEDPASAVAAVQMHDLRGRLFGQLTLT